MSQYITESSLEGMYWKEGNQQVGSVDVEEDSTESNFGLSNYKLRGDHDDDTFLNQKSLFTRVKERFNFDLHQSIEDISLSEDDTMSNGDFNENRSSHDDEEQQAETLGDEYNNKKGKWNIITADDQKQSPKDKHVHHHHFLDFENPDSRNAMLEALGVIEQLDGKLVSDATSYVEEEEKSEIAKFIEQYCSFTTDSNVHKESKEKSPQNSRTGKSMLDLSYTRNDGKKKSGKVQIVSKATSPNISHLSNVSSIVETSEQVKQIDSMISKLLNGYSPEKNTSYISPQYPDKQSNIRNETSINLLSQYASPLKKSPTKQLEKKTLTKPVPFNFSLDKRKRETMVDKSQDHENKKMAECTFHPSISYYNSGVGETESFIERVNRWKEKVENEKKSMEKKLIDSKEKDCSFRPEINAFSLRKQDEDVAVHDRLYVDSFKIMDRIEESRNKYSEDEIKRTCTFKPKIKSTNAQPKYLEPKKQNEPKNEESVECTFKPNILDPIVSNQASIRYLSEDPFLRLSRRLASDDTAIKKKTQNKEQSRPKSAGRNKKTGNFEEFLKRQNQTMSKKEEKIDLIRQTEFSYKPALNNKSRELFNGLDHEKRNEILQKHKKKEKSVS